MVAMLKKIDILQYLAGHNVEMNITVTDKKRECDLKTDRIMLVTQRKCRWR